MKSMKKGMALGALMAFVITGSAMAAETNYETTKLGKVQADSVEGFKENSSLSGLSGSGWSAFFPENSGDSPDRLVITKDITYGGGHFGLYAGYRVGNNGQRLDNPDGNVLDIKGNLTVSNGSANLYACALDSDNESEASASNNSIYVGGEGEPIVIKLEGTGEADHIFIGGAVSINHKNILNVEDNKAIVDNVQFKLSENNYVCIYGGEARGGSAKDNEVVIKDTAIRSANIFGGLVNTNGGDATSNTVTFNNVTVGEKSDCAGGYVNGYIWDAKKKEYVIDVKGDANSNTVNIEGNSIVAGNLYGGYSDNGSASNNTVNIKDAADVSKAQLFGDNDKNDGTGNTLNIESGWIGAIGSVENFDVINIDKGAVVTLNDGMDCSDGTTNINGAILELGGATEIRILDVKNDSKVVFGANGHLDVNDVNGSLTITEAGKTADDLNTAEQLTTVAAKLGVAKEVKDDVDAKVVMAAGAVKGETSGDIVFETEHGEYLDGVVKSVTVKVNTTNASISEMHSLALMAWRAENNDMHKRLGELRDANGEHGAWVRMTRGESEYESVKNQYNAYQMGYDQKAGDWTVGAAVTYTEGETGFAKGSGENDHTGFAVYGSKLNNDGTYIDLVAKYAKLDHEYTVNGGIGSGEYDTDGLALSAEYGKRFEKGNGLWIEPQVELTYGQVDSVDFEAENGTVSLDNMNSLVGRVGFRAGKDIKDGNVYVRASYLYDFEGEADIAFSDGTNNSKFEQDLGGGWYEIGLGANINLSKATYIYADVEHACGGEVDTDWKWNLGVRYSF